ncbi:MAG: glutaredoxin family protein [Deltaproteobacteria bacterium]|nr:glutaredoxin family protein [Deltaproteobacteria bacterium]
MTGIDATKRIVKVTAGLFLIIAFLVIPDMAPGELYRWVDENGVVHFDETRPENGESAVKVEPQATNSNNSGDIEDSGTEAVRGNSDSETAPEREVKSENAPAREAELYITRRCIYCKMAADFLRSKGVPFKWYDIERDSEAALRKMEMDPKPGVPFAVINGFRIHGFSVEAYEKALSFNPQDQESE